MPFSNSSTHVTEAHHHHSITLSHPHPLRSYSRPEDILAMDNASDNNSIRPDSFVLARTDIALHHTGRRGSLQPIRRHEENMVHPPLPSPTQQTGFVRSSQTGFSDAPCDYYPVIPVRPPLRPTLSNYSFDSDDMEPWVGKQHSVTVTVEEDGEKTSSSTRMDWRDMASVACLCLLNFMCDLSATSLSTALPDITAELQLSSAETLWIPASYLLASSLSQPLFMRLSSALGSKALLLFGLTLFAMGNTVSGLASNGTFLLSGRSIEGFGAGAITVLTQLISSRLCRERSFVRRFGPSGLHLFWSGIAIGPVIGGAFAQYTSWRTIFWLQLHPSIIGLLVLPFLLRLPYFESGAGFRQLLKVDFLGWLLLSAAVTPVMVAISSAGTQNSWNSWHTLVPLIVGFMSLASWSVYNRYRIEPVLPISIFHKWSAMISCVGATVMGSLVFGIVYLMPAYFQASGMSSTVAGVSLTPWTLGILVSTTIAGLFIKRVGHRWMTWIAWAIVACTAGLMILPDHLATPTFFIPVGLACGTATGTLLVSLATAIDTAASNDDETIHAAPLYLFFITLGQSIGVIGGSAIYHATASFQTIWIVACALAGTTFLLSLCFMRSRQHVLL